ncbi:MAG TPA: helix-turn-helix domain-containing protein [Blastocatellia bacterium]|nr:helix-turn-helix domain-containing protein [Blastocatellia bacterium]
MIKNERQYRITKAEAERFERALNQMDSHADPSNKLHPLLQKAQREALQSQLEDLRAQLAEYEALRAGARTVIARESFEDLPSALIQARIASGLSQRELAERLGIKEQQVQRYEATDYAAASLERVMEIIKALGISVREDVFLPNAMITPARFFSRLQEVGFKRDFVLKKMLPHSLAAQLQSKIVQGLDKYVLQAATIVCRILRCTVAEFFDAAPLQLNTFPALGTARFKLPATAREPQVKAYTIYAHHMALLALQATEGIVPKPIPTEPDEVRQAILSSFGAVTFEDILKYAWGLGVTVLPLSDRGTFHGACWRVQGRNIIVLKQQTASVARWSFDFLHEFRHIGQDPEVDELCIIESSETSKERRDSEEEQTCSQFAGDVLLNGRAEELVEICVQASKGKVPLLTNVIPRIAAKENVSVGALANHMAYRLWQDEVTNWWGAATNLQEVSTEPWRVARDIFLQHANFRSLNEVDRSLLQLALSDPED